MGTYDLLIAFLFTGIVVAGVAVILKLMKDKTKKISTLRLFIQIAAVVVIFMGLIIGPFGVPRWQPLGTAPRDRLVGKNILGLTPDGISVPVLACYYASGRTVTCPIWQMQAYVFPLWGTGRGYEAIYTTPGLERLAVVVGLVIVMALVLGRFFCGWLCPLGLYMDVMTRIRSFTGKKHRNFSKKTNKKLGQLRYVIIAVFLVISVVFASQAIFGTQLVPGTEIGRAPHRPPPAPDVPGPLSGKIRPATGSPEAAVLGHHQDGRDSV